MVKYGMRPAFEAARDIVRGLVAPAPVDLVPLAHALGHVLARPVAAVAGYPRFDCSAMDGFAIPSLDPTNDAVPLDPSDATIILTTGGVSVGAHDCVPGALRSLGASIHFHGVRMRPGKPFFFATMPSGKLVFGLSGNPVAAATAFRFFVMEAIRFMVGLGPDTGVPVSLDVEGRAGTTLVLKARRISQSDEAFALEQLPGQQSHRMRSMLTADYWAVVDDA